MMLLIWLLTACQGGLAQQEGTLPDPIAASVGRSTDLVDWYDPVIYPEIRVDRGNAWNRTTNIFTTGPTTSIYFFHLNSASMSGRRINTSVRGAAHFDVLRFSNNHNGIDTTGRDFIMPVAAGTEIRVINEHGSSSYSDGNMQTSFTAFDLQSLLSLSQQKIFSVALQEGFTELAEIVFPEVLVNVGEDFDNIFTNSRFYIKETGVYFVSFSVGVPGSKISRVSLFSDNLGGIITEVWYYSNVHNGEDTISKSVLLYLEAGDYIHLELMEGQIRSDNERQTTFSGFRWAPLNGPEHVWSVYSDKTVVAPGDDPLIPFPFDGTFLNNDMFDFGSNSINITETGLYYMAMSMHTNPGKELDAYIVRDRSTLANLYKTSTNENGQEVVSIGFLAELEAGNTIHVELNRGTEVYSDFYKGTTFCGMLLHPFDNIDVLIPP